ncbi:MAG TPA: high-potential iron-sulfur protein [Sphingobium sp.]|uniref:high-potential iron-sulfur protein n=1 Tax=Sphingobium sp. TaxID=1912891 RepID=UPI002ED58FE2
MAKDFRVAEQGRRDVLRLIAGASLLTFSSASMAEICFDPAKLPNAGMRRSLNFQAVASDPKKRCAGCAFFTRALGDCGKCSIFSGGPVSVQSVCDSWAPKG